MTDRLPFGTRVHIDAYVLPRYLTWFTSRRSDVARDDHGRIGFYDTEPIDPPVLGAAGDPWAYDPAEPIGERLPGSPDVPRGGVHRRLRRYADPVDGIVVGWVWRAEGQYHGGAAGYAEFDTEPAYLAETSRHNLYQIAVDTGDGTRRAAPARVILAHPDDVRPQVTEADR